MVTDDAGDDLFHHANDNNNNHNLIVQPPQQQLQLGDNNTNDEFQPMVYHKKKYQGKGTYSGYFINGKRDGQGVYIDKNGNHYTGGWKEDRAHGYGKKTFKKTGVCA